MGMKKAKLNAEHIALPYNSGLPVSLIIVKALCLSGERGRSEASPLNSLLTTSHSLV